MFVKLKCKSNDQTKLQNNCIILTSRLINIKTTSFLHHFHRQHLKSTEIVISTSISISTNKKTATTWSTSSTAEGIVSQPLSSYLRRKKTATRSKTSSTTKRIVSQTLSSHFILQPDCQSHIIQVSTISNTRGMSKWVTRQTNDRTWVWWKSQIREEVSFDRNFPWIKRWCQNEWQYENFNVIAVSF